MTTDQTAQAPQSGLLSPQFISNPYPIYDAMRALGPIFRDPVVGWVTADYETCASILRDPRFSAERIATDEQLEQWGISAIKPIVDIERRMMLFVDAPDHTRLRGLVSKAFTPRAVEAMRPQIQVLVDDLLSRVRGQGEMDLMRDLAIPLPTSVIISMLGVPQEDRPQLKKWSADFAIIIGSFEVSMEQWAQLQESMLEFKEYFRRLVRQVRQNPKDDLLSAMALAEVQGDRLTEDELLANCILLIAAGHETTTNLIGNGILALLRNPDQLEKLKANPSLIASAIEELLRYDSPVQLTGRTAREDLELDGHTIERGHEVITLLGGANRDPKRFADPHRLDITRQDNKHLSFAIGSHFCLGAPLARLEGQIAINTLLREMPGLRLAVEPERLEWQPNQVLHGLKSLPLTW